MKKSRKHYTAEEKVAILRRHLLEGAAGSVPCDELGLRPAMTEGDIEIILQAAREQRSSSASRA